MAVSLVNGRYRIDKCVGKGSFGDVYIGYDEEEQEVVAIKMAESSKAHILKHEYGIYSDLVRSKKPPLIPTIYWFGNVPETGQSVIVMQYLGNSLEYLFTQCGGKFSLKTTLMVCLQVFDLLMKLHDCGYVHRDIKPDNFLLGIGPSRHRIYLIDFGLTKRFKTEDRVHIKPNQNKKLTGTARYASINSHRRLELSRRDDLESLGYLMVYFLKGRLPWQGIPGDTKEEKYRKIGEMKAAYRLDLLCEGLPGEILKFLEHVRALEFKEKPNYHYLRSLLLDIFTFDFDYHYDWTPPEVQVQVQHGLGLGI